MYTYFDDLHTMFDIKYQQKAEEIFIHPSAAYPWENIINGTSVSDKYGNQRKMYAVAQNTFRGFHRIDKSCSGAKEEFLAYFTSKEYSLINKLLKIDSREDLNDLENMICVEIHDLLSNCNPNQLSSYNKIRKPVDLYIEHLVAMSKELDGARDKLIPFLFLPLDSQILRSLNCLIVMSWHSTR